jgi:RHS repeat-associated protein
VLVDDAGRVTKFEYGGLGWMTKATSPSGTATEFRYDVEGNLTWIRNPRGQVFRQWFDPASRCVACESFEGVRRDAGYDPAGRAKWLEDPFGREIREYDPDGRLSAAEFADGGTVSIKYGDDGLIVIGAGPTKLERQFDASDHIVRDRQGAHESHVSWNGGRVVGIQSDTGVPIRYERNLSGTLSSIHAGGTTVHLDEPSGGDVVTRLGRTLLLRRTSTPTGKLAFQSITRFHPNTALDVAGTSTDPRVIAWRRYEYDAAQNLIAEHRSDGSTIEYEVTREDQVSVRRARNGGRVITEERLAYDAAGTPVLAGAHFDSAMRPIELNGEKFEYDKLGRLIRRQTDAGEWIYEWSANDDLVRVSAPDHVVEMQYDATGRRLRKRVLRQKEIVRSISYVWSNHVPLHEIDDLDGTTRTYIRRDEAWEPVGHVDVRAGIETATFYVNDPIGALDFAVDEAGNVVFDGERTLYGQVVPSVRKVDVTTRFPNQFYDSDVELVYNTRRWYEPRLGLYITPDPLLLAGTLNPRDYSPNPLRYVDPMGLTSDHPGPTSNPPSPANGHAPTPGVPGQADFGSTGNYTLQPGHWATEGGVGTNSQTGATGYAPGYAEAPGKLQTQQGSWPKGVRDTVDAAGYTHGCHGCGSKDPGTKTGHFIPDHQPQVNQTKAAGRENQSVASVRLYPHCKNCSTAQRDQAGNHARTNTDAQRAAAAQAASDRNASHSPTVGPSG